MPTSVMQLRSVGVRGMFLISRGESLQSFRRFRFSYDAGSRAGIVAMTL